MKNKIYNIYLILMVVLGLSSCTDDFLNRSPLDQISTENFFGTPEEMKLYLNQFYQNSFQGHPGTTGGSGIAFDDAGSDNMVMTKVNTRLNGETALSNAQKITEYSAIRNINYLLQNYGKCKGDLKVINQYVGEARFFRALSYFNLVKKYGDVTWINKVLPSDQEFMKVVRDPRIQVIDSVLNDLNVAANLLPAYSNSSLMRVHKDVALALKSRIALYEGTWQKYHKANGDTDPFWTRGITDTKITSYFDQAKAAANEVMTSGRWSIYSTGKPEKDYENLFITRDLSTNPEVMLWKKYVATDNIGHGVSKYISTAGADIGISLSLVDDYLTRTGEPFIGNARSLAQSVYASELMSDKRDPRLSQTVAIPGKPLRPGEVVPAFPPINQSGFNRSTTGFPLYKYLEYDNMDACRDDNKSTAPAIQIRYAEVLLNYAEAVAELNGDPNLIKTALKPLRLRAGMPEVDFDREFNASSDYAFRNLSKVLQSVRRERRVELACEGSRLDDILRWAAADLLIVGKRPLGTLFTGSNIANENTSTGFFKDAILYYDSAPQGKSINLFLTAAAGSTVRYIDPYKGVLANGFQFKLGRDYLLPISQRMIQLTDGKWLQNPGW